MTTSTTKIDLSRPVEAVCKRTGRVVPLGTARSYTPMNRQREAGVLIQTATCPCSATSNNLWYADGRDYCHLDQWTLRNVVEVPAIGTEMRCLGYYTIRGKVIAHIPGGGAVVQSSLSATAVYVLDANLRDPSGDLWAVVPEKPNRTVYRNIYADGSFGSTEHGSYTDALAHTKYGKVAVGYLKQTLNGDGAVIDARVYGRTPQLRTRGGAATNPFAK